MKKVKSTTDIRMLKGLISKILNNVFLIFNNNYENCSIFSIWI